MVVQYDFDVCESSGTPRDPSAADNFDKVHDVLIAARICSLALVPFVAPLRIDGRIISALMATNSAATVHLPLR